MTPAQCREARALAGMSQAELAAAAGVSVTLVSDFEIGAWIRPADLDALQDALERAGIEFTDDGERPVSRLRK